MDIQNLFIVGAGTMGTGIAQVGAQAGMTVMLIDSDETALEKSRLRLTRSVNGAVERGKLDAGEAAAVIERVSWGDNYAALAEADWIIEAVFEDLDVKKHVLGLCAGHARPGVCVATNTSTLPMHRLAEFFGRPEHFVGMHFFNPPPVMKLVEIIPGEKTSEATLQAAFALCEQMGKTPLQTPDIPGFIVNRAFGALLAAAIDVWSQGASAESIDTALELGLGHKMGPLKTCDLVGLDIVRAMNESLLEMTGHDRFTLPPAFYELIEQGKLGVKSGEGFYRYD